MSIINHDEAFRDRAAMLAMRAMIVVSGSFSIEPGAREAYDQLIARTKIANDVDTAQAEDGAILYVHGGGYVLGGAKAYRGLASQIARAPVARSSSSTTLWRPKTPSLQPILLRKGAAPGPTIDQSASRDRELGRPSAIRQSSDLNAPSLS